MSASIELTMEREIERVHIVLASQKEVIYYATKYMKQGWKVYSIDVFKSIEIHYHCE